MYIYDLPDQSIGNTKIFEQDMQLSIHWYMTHAHCMHMDRDNISINSLSRSGRICQAALINRNGQKCVPNPSVNLTNYLENQTKSIQLALENLKFRHQNFSQKI